MGGVQNPGLLFTTLASNAQGIFSFHLTLDKLPDGSSFRPGSFTFVVVTENGSIGKEVIISLER
jgi:hypothetical protein